MTIFKKRKSKMKQVGNRSRKWITNYIWAAEGEMLDNAPKNITSVDFSLIALHAMLKPRLEIMIGLLLDLRDRKDIEDKK